MTFTHTHTQHTYTHTQDTHAHTTYTHTTYTRTCRPKITHQQELFLDGVCSPPVAVVHEVVVQQLWHEGGG